MIIVGIITIKKNNVHRLNRRLRRYSQAYYESFKVRSGVSASHIDWTMVPYVRKSFFKHYKDGLKYLDEGKEVPEVDIVNTSIEDDIYKNYSPKAYKYAMDMTVRETHQAIEGMYHNLKYLGD